MPYCLWHLRDAVVVRTDVGTIRRPEWEDAEHQAERAPLPRPAGAAPFKLLLVGAVVAALLAAWRFFM